MYTGPILVDREIKPLAEAGGEKWLNSLHSPASSANKRTRLLKFELILS